MKILIGLIILAIILLMGYLVYKSQEDMSRIRRGVGADGDQEIPVASGIITSYIEPDNTYTYFDGVNEVSCDMCPTREVCPSCPQYKYAMRSLVTDIADSYDRKTKPNIIYAQNIDKFSATGPAYYPKYDVIHYGDETLDYATVADLDISAKQPDEIIFGDATKDIYKHVGPNHCIQVFRPTCGENTDRCDNAKSAENFTPNSIIIDSPVIPQVGPGSNNEPQTGIGSTTKTITIKPGSVNTAISAFMPEMRAPNNKSLARSKGTPASEKFYSEPVEEEFMGGNTIKMKIIDEGIPQQKIIPKGKSVYNCQSVYNKFNAKIQNELYSEILGLDYSSAPSAEDCEYYNSQNNYIYKEPCMYA